MAISTEMPRPVFANRRIVELGIALLAAGAAALVVTEPAGMMLVLFALLAVLAALHFDFFLCAMVFLLPWYPFVNWKLPLRDAVVPAHLLLFAGVWVQQIKRGATVKDWLWKGWTRKGMLAFAAIALLSLLISESRATLGPYKALAKLLSYVAMLLSVAAWAHTKERIATVIKLLMVSTIGVALFGIRMCIAIECGPQFRVQRDGTVYELFVTRLPEQAFTPQDVLDLYLHRGSFEIVLADEDSEQDTDRWCSHTPAGQEFWQIVNQWVWNLRLELGHALHPTSMRTTEFAPVREPAPAADPERTLEKDSTPKGFSPRDYGPPQWARRSFTGGFPGSAFLLQADGTLLCPAPHRLYPQERRPERDGSYRVLYAARTGDCRACELRVQCQESVSTVKPRRVSAVFWPRLTIPSEVATLPVLGPPQPLPSPPLPVLWRDWPRRSIRRNWLKVLRSETVAVSLDASPTSPSETREPVFTRAERAHWRMTWPQRLARNARSSTASSLTLLLHGLSATFAHRYGFAFLDAT